MKHFICIVLISYCLSNCTHRIVRTGYKVNTFNYSDCEVIFDRSIELSDTIAKKIGEIKLGESGFSAFCNEEDALNILKNEACAINADLILIKEEKRPNIWSSCYRCKAEFYKFKSIDIKMDFVSDEAYKTDNVNRRVASDKGKNIVIGTVLGGVLMFLLIMR